MLVWSLLPLVSFLLLFCTERLAPARKDHPSAFSPADWVLNLIGFVVQGVVVPLAGYLLAREVFPNILSSARGTLTLGFAGAFALNLIGVDLLYYFQHRAFHQLPALWKLHSTHHFSPTMNLWATSRNALVTNFLFVYLLLNPVLAYLCDSPEGFFAGAMVTASLDLFRHANIALECKWLQGWLVLPKEHHRHHDADKPPANFGANFIIWDRLFGTFAQSKEWPARYAGSTAPSFTTQLFLPWRTR